MKVVGCYKKCKKQGSKISYLKANEEDEMDRRNTTNAISQESNCEMTELRRVTSQLEMESLTDSTPSPKVSSSQENIEPGTSFRRRNILIITVLSVCFLFLTGTENASLTPDAVKSQIRTHDDVTTSVKTDFDIDQVIEKVRLSIDKKEEEVRKEYGEYFDLFFTTASSQSKNQGLNYIFHPSEETKERLLRRLQYKVLSAHLGSDTKMVWTTGGHSAAAGHGNLVNQTYTAHLEKTVKKTFEEIGISFEARNHAVGGMKSVPETSLCMESFYGADTDILSWDFSMTDGSRDVSKNMILWSHRAAVLSVDRKRLPIFFMLSDGQNVEREINKNGGSTLWPDTNRIHELQIKLPDYSEVPLDHDAPPAIKYLMCGGWPETNQGPCRANKFDTASYCASAKYQVNWHSGWKAHMVSTKLW